MRIFEFLKKKNKISEPVLVSLPELFIDEDRKIWLSKYKYDDVVVQTTKEINNHLRINQMVEFCVASDNMKELSSIEVVLNGALIGYLESFGQRCMIRDYKNKDEALVKAKITAISNKSLQLQIYYYRSKTYFDRQREAYEAEKAAYVRQPTIIMDVMLVSNKNESMQYDILCCETGDSIEIMEENDDKFIVTAKGILDIGYLPKKIVKKLYSLEEEGYDAMCKGRILEISVNENGKRDVKVQLMVEDTNYL